MKDKSVKKFNVNYRIFDVIIKRELFFSDLINLKEDLSLFTFEINASVNVTYDKRLLNWKLILKIFKDQAKKIILADFEIEVAYLFESLDNIVVNKKEKVLFNEAILKSFLNNAISILRGIIITKTYNTPLRKAYLPNFDDKMLNDLIEGLKRTPNKKDTF